MFVFMQFVGQDLNSLFELVNFFVKVLVQAKVECCCWYQ